MNRPNKKYSQGFAVVRVDTPVDQTHPENSISVLKIFGTKETANAERDRLSRVNAGKDCLLCGLDATCKVRQEDN